jgi:hypothetical protein
VLGDGVAGDAEILAHLRGEEESKVTSWLSRNRQDQHGAALSQHTVQVCWP